MVFSTKSVILSRSSMVFKYKISHLCAQTGASCRRHHLQNASFLVRNSSFVRQNSSFFNTKIMISTHWRRQWPHRVDCSAIFVGRALAALSCDCGCCFDLRDTAFSTKSMILSTKSMICSVRSISLSLSRPPSMSSVTPASNKLIRNTQKKHTVLMRVRSINTQGPGVRLV